MAALTMRSAAATPSFSDCLLLIQDAAVLAAAAAAAVMAAATVEDSNADVSATVDARCTPRYGGTVNYIMNWGEHRKAADQRQQQWNDA